MASTYRSSYQVDMFRGLNEMQSENRMASGFSPDAENFDTANGDLAVGHGYSKHINTACSGTDAIKRLYHWHTASFDKWIVCAAQHIYVWSGSAWSTVYTYGSAITTDTWDITECRIGNTDTLLISNGGAQIVKYDGTTASDFGSGEYVYDKKISSVHYNMYRATDATYSISSSTGTYTLTVPSFSFSVGAQVSFKVPANIGTVTACNISISGTSYALAFIPVWASGDEVVITATTAAGNKFNPSEDEYKYGVDYVVLNTALTSAQQSRALAVGITLNGITYPVEEIPSTTKVVLRDICTAALAANDPAQIRGGVSDIHVAYTEIYYSRLFAAGDASNPSRLYWSQPPGDTRNIEDWSMDDASDSTGGGHVEVGRVSGDKITGLCAMSNQLLIFKEHSIWRLLGDRPSNYRVVEVSGGADPMCNTSLCSKSGIPYWLTNAGMYFHNGQSSVLTSNAKLVKNTLDAADLSTCKGAANRDRLYFTIRRGPGSIDNAIIVYDMIEGTYNLRTGFNVSDICAFDGMLYMINDNRYVYVWDKSTDYDGQPIVAYWNTPLTDLSAKGVTKAFKWLYFRGEGGIAQVTYKIGKFSINNAYQMPSDDGDVICVPLLNEGKVFKLTIANEAGSWFKLLGGAEIVYEVKGD